MMLLGSHLRLARRSRREGMGWYVAQEDKAHVETHTIKIMFLVLSIQIKYQLCNKIFKINHT